MQQTIQVPVAQDEDLVSFELPGGAAAALDGAAVQADVTSIVSVVGVDFVFQENANTPGRFLEQTRVVTRPPGSGFFVGINSIRSAFTSADFQFLRERPLGQVYASLGVRGNNQLVCQVRLTDSNGDDPVDVRVRGFIAFYN